MIITKLRVTFFRACGHPLLGKMMLTGFACLVLSFFIYFFQKLTGALPDRAEWFRAGILGPNHGPWHMKPEGFLVLSPYLWLVPSTFIASMLLAAWKRRPILIVHGIGLSVVLVLMAVFQMQPLGWTID